MSGKKVSSKVEKSVEIQPDEVVKRFVLNKKRYGKGLKIQWTTAFGETYIYDHDAILDAERERFDNMTCWKIYKTYSQTYNVPKFARPYSTLIGEAKK